MGGEGRSRDAKEKRGMGGLKTAGTGKCVTPSLASQFPLVPKGGPPPYPAHDARGAHAGAILTSQHARPVRGSVDSRSDTPLVSPLRGA